MGEPNDLTQPITPLTFEERGLIAGRLLLLRDTGKRNRRIWKTEIEAVLASVSMLAPFLKALKEIEIPEEEASESDIKKIVDIVNAALRAVEAQQTPDVFRLLVVTTVEHAIWQSAPVRMGKWLLPSLATLAFGGTLLSLYRVDGAVDAVLKTATNSQKEMRQSQEKVTKEAKAATNSLQDTRNKVDTDVKDQIKEQVDRQLADFKKAYTEAQDDARKETERELNAFNASLSDLKNGYETQIANIKKVYTEAQDNARKEAEQGLKALNASLSDSKNGYEAQIADSKKVYTEAHDNARKETEQGLKAFNASLSDSKNGYEAQIANLFKPHKNDFDTYWRLKEQNLNVYATDKLNAVTQHLDQQSAQADSALAKFTTRLDTTLANADQQVPGLVKQINDLKPQIDSIKTLLAVQDELQALIKRLDDAAVGGSFLQFVRILVWKDVLLIFALVVSFIALVMSFITLRRFRRLPMNAPLNQP